MYFIFRPSLNKTHFCNKPLLIIKKRNTHKTNLSLTTNPNHSFTKFKHVNTSLLHCKKPRRFPYKHYWSNDNSFCQFINESGNNNNLSLKQIIPKTKDQKLEETIDILDNIQINDDYEREHLNKCENTALNSKLKNQIVVNISTIYNKGNKLPLSKPLYKNNVKKILTESNVNDEKERNELNNKIKKLLEINMKLLDEKTEIENENKILNESISKYKRCICNNNSKEYQQCKNILMKYKTEYQLCLKTMNILEKEKDSLLQEKSKFQKKQLSENKLKRAPIKFTTFKKQNTITIDPDVI